MAPPAPKTGPAHPPYLALITEAISSLKERGGSSYPAIKKYIGAHHKLPTGWEKTLSLQLKRQLLAGKLVRIKASYKLGEALKKEVKVRPSPHTAPEARDRRSRPPETLRSGPLPVHHSCSCGRLSGVASGPPPNRKPTRPRVGEEDGLRVLGDLARAQRALPRSPSRAQTARIFTLSFFARTLRGRRYAGNCAARTLQLSAPPRARRPIHPLLPRLAPPFLPPPPPARSQAGSKPVAAKKPAKVRVGSHRVCNVRFKGRARPARPFGPTRSCPCLTPVHGARARETPEGASGAFYSPAGVSRARSSLPDALLGLEQAMQSDRGATRRAEASWRNAPRGSRNTTARRLHRRGRRGGRI